MIFHYQGMFQYYLSSTGLSFNNFLLFSFLSFIFFFFFWCTKEIEVYFFEKFLSNAFEKRTENSCLAYTYSNTLMKKFNNFKPSFRTFFYSRLFFFFLMFYLFMLAHNLIWRFFSSSSIWNYVYNIHKEDILESIPYQFIIIWF